MVEAAVISVPSSSKSIPHEMRLANMFATHNLPRATHNYLPCSLLTNQLSRLFCVFILTSYAFKPNSRYRQARTGKGVAVPSHETMKMYREHGCKALHILCTGTPWRWLVPVRNETEWWSQRNAEETRPASVEHRTLVTRLEMRLSGGLNVMPKKHVLPLLSIEPWEP
jgi:hypothetical protein